MLAIGWAQEAFGQEAGLQVWEPGLPQGQAVQGGLGQAQSVQPRQGGAVPLGWQVGSQSQKGSC